MRELKPITSNWNPQRQSETHEDRLELMRTYTDNGTCVYHCVKNLAKLVHGIAASTSILFGQVACKDLKLTLAPSGKHMPSIAPHKVTSKYKFLTDLSQQALGPSLLCFLAPACLICPLDKTLMALTKFLLFWLELTNLALAQEPQNTPPKDPNKGMCHRACLSFWLKFNFVKLTERPWPSVCPLEVCHVLPPVLTSNKLLFWFLLWSVAEPPLTTLVALTHHPVPCAPHNKC